MQEPVPESTPVPRPSDWAMLHSKLTQAWEARPDAQVPKPPVPLILGGAAFSTAAAIQQRWRDLIAWANQHGFSDVLAAHLPAPATFDVADQIAGVSADGRGWWPAHWERSDEAKPRPSPDVLASALCDLAERWPAVVGPELGLITRPLKFTGRKSRRLLVAADPTAALPPWGSWSSTAVNPGTFTELRRAVNGAIAPLVVDDISFDTAAWGEPHGNTRTTATD